MRYPPYSQTKLDRMSWVLKRSEKSDGGWGYTLLIPVALLALAVAVYVKVSGAVFLFSRASLRVLSALRYCFIINSSVSLNKLHLSGF